MTTTAQDAFSEAFSDLAGIHGQTWTFGTASFAGVASLLKPKDPRLVGSADRLIEVSVLTANLPVTPPKRGDEISSGGKIYRIARLPDKDLSTGITSFLAVLT